MAQKGIQVSSLDFEQEKRAFLRYYESNRGFFEEAKNAFVRALTLVVRDSDVGEVTKIEGRIKEKEECVKKFQRKYQQRLELDEQPYEIAHYISDLIGIRIVCLYEDQIARVSDLLERQFDLIQVTDKIAAVESTEDSFGYKGLHLDLSLKPEMADQPKLKPFAGFIFEVQIRSLIQDAWSVLDHKIKYKKSIPNDLKRRINVLSALFELADREFKEIRNATQALMREAEAEPDTEPVVVPVTVDTPQGEVRPVGRPINAFSFMRVAGHFFADSEFKAFKVDNFVQDILALDPEFSRAELHAALEEHGRTVKEYRDEFREKNPESSFSAYTAIRHALFLYDRERFERVMSRWPRERFDAWLKGRGGQNVCEKIQES